MATPHGEIQRLKERIRDLSSVLRELERQSDASSQREAQRIREQIKGIEYEIQSMQSGGKRP